MYVHTTNQRKKTKCNEEQNKMKKTWWTERSGWADSWVWHKVTFRFLLNRRPWRMSHLSCMGEDNCPKWISNGSRVSTAIWLKWLRALVSTCPFQLQHAILQRDVLHPPANECQHRMHSYFANGGENHPHAVPSRNKVSKRALSWKIFSLQKLPEPVSSGPYAHVS